MQIDHRVLGRRVAEARGRAGLTQAELAREIDLDRSALAKIESGDRRVSALELSRIAQAVGTRVESFLAEPTAAIVSHRHSADPGAPSPRIDAEVERRAQAVEFVASLDREVAEPDLPTSDMPTDRVEAEALAVRARTLLDVDAVGPLPWLARAVERIGVRVFVTDLGVDAADAATVLLRAGAVSVINGAFAIGRRRVSLAHEIGHVLVADEYTVDWRVQSAQGADRREALFDAFARALLLPERSLRAGWGADGGLDARATAVRLASEYRVDFSTLARRLLDLELVDAAGAATVRRHTTTRADIVEMGLVVPPELDVDALPRGYVRSVLRLYRGERISADRALDLLMGVFSESDLPVLPLRPEDEIWQFVG